MRKPKVGNPCVVVIGNLLRVGKIISAGNKWIQVDCSTSKYSAFSLCNDYGHKLFLGSKEEYIADINQRKVENKLREEITENLKHLCEDNLIKIRDMTSEMF